MYSSWNLHNKYTALLLQLIYKRNYSNTTAKTRTGDQRLSQCSAPCRVPASKEVQSVCAVSTSGPAAISGLILPMFSAKYI